MSVKFKPAIKFKSFSDFIVFFVAAFFVAILQISTLNTSRADIKIESANENDLFGLTPAFHYDHTGFISPNQLNPELENELEKINPSTPIFPLFPLFKSKFGGKKLIGVKIPSKYLGLSKQLSKQLSNQSNVGGNGLLVSNNLISKIHRYPKKIQDAMYLIRNIPIENGHLNPYFYKGELYGIHSKYQVIHSNSNTRGFSLSFGGFSNTITLGDNYTMGFDIKVGVPVARIGEIKGYNFADKFNSIFEGFDILKDKDSTESLIQKTLSFTPYTLQYLANSNRNNDEFMSSEFMRRKRADEIPESTYNKNLQIDMNKDQSLLLPILREDLSRELQGQLSDLSKNLKKEIDWKSKVKEYASSTQIYKNEEANNFIQQICDMLSSGFQMPKEIWPRCRIAASLIPNAWAYPGGDIFVSVGFIGVLSKLDSLMLVLGHEIGHVIGRHTTKRAPLIDAYTYASMGLGISSSAFSIGGGWGYMKEVTWLSWFPQVIRTSLVTENVAKFFMFPVAAGVMAYSRSNEWQADRFGHQIALATGNKQEEMYSGWGEFLSFFNKFANREKTLLNSIFASHPDGVDRHQEIQDRFSDYSYLVDKYSENRASQAHYDFYSTLHHKFKPLTLAFGNYLKQKLEKQQNSSNNSSSLHVEHIFNSFFAPGGRCVLHALGGVKHTE